jgi:cytochrome c
MPADPLRGACIPAACGRGVPPGTVFTMHDIVHRAALIVSLVTLAAAGCDSRSRAIKAELSPQEAALYDAGRRLSTDCWTCHDLYSETNKVGPTLFGVFGREIGSVPRFPYSQAFEQSQLVWNRQSIRSFLSNVPGFIPGTNMISRSVSSPTELNALVFYLEHATKP